MWERARANVVLDGRGGAERVEGEGWTRDGERGENGRDEDEGSREGGATMLERKQMEKKWKNGNEIKSRKQDGSEREWWRA